MPTLRQTLDYLRCDFNRYLASEQVGSRNAVGKLRILFRSPGFWAILVHRFGFWVFALSGDRVPGPLLFCLKLLYYFVRYPSVLLTRIYLLKEDDFGPGLYLDNGGNILVGGKRFGANLTISRDTTIGQSNMKSDQIPDIGDNVVIGRGCLVFGKITVGDGSVIEDFAILSKSVPPDSMVRGNPAQVVRMRAAEPECRTACGRQTTIESHG